MLTGLDNLVPLILMMAGRPQGQQSSQGGGGFEMFLPMIIIFAIFYFLLIRPQTKKQKEHQQMLNELKNGDRVLTSGGIYGTVVRLEDQVVHLKIADKVKIQVSRSAVNGLVNESGEQK